MSRKRQEFSMSPEAYALLEKLAENSGKSMAQVLLNGLALFGIAQEEVTGGRQLGIVDGEKVIKEILIPE